MKLSGIFGKGSGKVGSSVFAVSGGEQIVREYNPKVSNPSTDAQVEQRAKLKLLSQIAAALFSIIAFAKKGLVSARNQFISANYPLTTFEEGQASILVDAIDLTGGSKILPDLGAGLENQYELSGAADASIDAVLYAAVHSNADDKLEVVKRTIVSDPGVSRTFPATLTGLVAGDYVFAYGISYANKSDKVRYDNYISALADSAATLDVVKSMVLSGATFTITKGFKLT